MHYWDTSALVKLYVAEPNSAQFAAHLQATGPTATSELARWEAYRVLARKQADGVIASEAADSIFAKFESDVAAGGIILLPMNNSVENRFRQLVARLHQSSPPVFTRTLDAIHLATADFHNATEMVATDVNLRKCAAAIGLKVYP